MKKALILSGFVIAASVSINAEDATRTYQGPGNPCTISSKVDATGNTSGSATALPKSDVR